VLSFYEMYRSEDDQPASKDSMHVLDRWIVSRLQELVRDVTAAMENYEIDKALKPIEAFIEDLSTWYLRRSRDRLKGDGNEKTAALTTLRRVLATLSKTMAPFTPFVSERLYQSVKGKVGEESVHLEGWPEEVTPDNGIIERMAEIRNIVSLALEARAKANIKIRQPLSQLIVKSKLKAVSTEDLAELLNLVREEVNVKSVTFDPVLEEEIDLNTNITPELKEEGQVRELLRFLQDMRKKAGLNPKDAIALRVNADEKGRKFLNAHKDEIGKAVIAKSIDYSSEEGEKVNLDGISLEVALFKK
jgi:isoleucyl-tRNA synthetase